MYDLILENGTVADGTGAPAYLADLALKDGKIAKIGALSSEKAERRIDASGRLVCPGFIDAHCHTDVFCAAYPGAEGKILQGVVTDVCGLCGGSAAPVGTGWLAQRRPGASGPPKAIRYGEYGGMINRQGNSTNIAMFVGNSNLRIHAMGYEDRPATPGEMETMKGMLREAMTEGAWGLSTGLTYVPSGFSSTEELIELSKVMKPFGGIYNSHMRNESDHVEEAVAEVIEIARKSGCKGHISHLKATGKKNHGKSAGCLRLIEDANREGIDITFDVYPYTASSIGLSAMLPSWVLEKGYGPNFETLKEPESVKKIAAGLERDDWENVVLSCGYDLITISYANGCPRYEGKSLSEIAKELGVSQPEAMLRVLIDSKGQAMTVYYSIDEADLEAFLKSPYCSIGTDAFARHYAGPTAEGKPHPRNYGGFPRFLRRYLLDRKLMGLEEGIRKMTSLPARTFGIAGRGEIREGYAADLLVLNLETIGDHGDYSTPNVRPTGIDYVIVDGKLAVDAGEFRDIRAGRMLRR